MKIHAWWFQQNYNGHGRKVYIQSICLIKSKALLIQWRKWLSIINLPPGGWLVLLENGTISWVHCLSLLLTDFTFSRGYNHINLDELILLLSLCHPCCHDSFVVRTAKVSKDEGGWERIVVDIHRMLHLVLLIIKMSLYWLIWVQCSFGEV